MVQAALDMRDYMEQRRIERGTIGKPAFEMRIGIHTGTVVAGIVGSKKFAYDIWGDPVNVAARMESAGEKGKVNVSAITFELIADVPALRCTPRGLIAAKGKGDLEMYFVDRDRSRSLNDHAHDRSQTFTGGDRDRIDPATQ